MTDVVRESAIIGINFVLGNLWVLLHLGKGFPKHLLGLALVPLLRKTSGKPTKFAFFTLIGIDEPYRTCHF